MVRDRGFRRRNPAVAKGEISGMLSIVRQRWMLAGLALLMVAPGSLRASDSGIATVRAAEQRPTESESNTGRRSKRTTVPLVLTISDGLPPRSAGSIGASGTLSDPARLAVQSGLGWTGDAGLAAADNGHGPHPGVLAAWNSRTCDILVSHPFGQVDCPEGRSALRSALVRSLPPTGPPLG